VGGGTPRRQRTTQHPASKCRLQAAGAGGEGYRPQLQSLPWPQVFGKLRWEVNRHTLAIVQGVLAGWVSSACKRERGAPATQGPHTTSQATRPHERHDNPVSCSSARGYKAIALHPQTMRRTVSSPTPSSCTHSHPHPPLPKQPRAKGLGLLWQWRVGGGGGCSRMGAAAAWLAPHNTHRWQDRPATTVPDRARICGTAAQPTNGMGGRWEWLPNQAGAWVLSHPLLVTAAGRALHHTCALFPLLSPPPPPHHHQHTPPAPHSPPPLSCPAHLHPPTLLCPLTPSSSSSFSSSSSSSSPFPSPPTPTPIWNAGHAGAWTRISEGNGGWGQGQEKRGQGAGELQGRAPCLNPSCSCLAIVYGWSPTKPRGCGARRAGKLLPHTHTASLPT
jgi:hypothetical protein